MKHARRHAQAGFTLIEIMVVFAIIALLVGYGLGSAALTSRTRARDTQRKTHLSTISKALELYINDHGTYPQSDANGALLGCGDPASPTACTWGADWTDSNGTKYMTLPADPSTGASYIYTSDGVAWQLYARIEKEDDPQIDNNGDGEYIPADDDFSECGTASACSCGSGNCNYGISSGNTRPGVVL